MKAGKYFPLNGNHTYTLTETITETKTLNY